MQDRSPPTRQNLLATHGRTIHLGHFLPVDGSPRHVGSAPNLGKTQAEIGSRRELRILKRRKIIPGSVLLKYFRNIACGDLYALFSKCARRHEQFR
jgi:hypothetical protein